MENNVYVLSTTDGGYVLAVPAFDDDVIGDVYVSDIRGKLHLLRNGYRIDLNLSTTDYADILKQAFVYVTEIDLSLGKMVRDYQAPIKAADATVNDWDAPVAPPAFLQK